jgi:hypothetical protein
MPFNLKDFNKTKFTARTEDVPVPEMAAFFAGGDPVWPVRGLTGAELSIVKQSDEAQKNLLAMAEALGGVSQKEKVDALREMFGVGSNLPPDYVRRIEILLQGSITEIDRQTAVKIATAYPVTLHSLTDCILKLTGLGQEPGKLPGSGATKESATP